MAGTARDTHSSEALLVPKRGQWMRQVYLHGAGLNADIWGDVPGLALNLPGHGGRDRAPTATAEAGVLWTDSPGLLGDLTPGNAPGAPAGAVGDSIQEAWFNANDQLLIGGRLSTGEDVLAKLTLSPAGAILTEEIIAIDGTTLAGHNAPIQGFSFSRRRQSINASGEVLWFVDDEQMTPGGTANTCCDSWIYRDSTAILHESEPVLPSSPNIIGTLSSVEVDPDKRPESMRFVADRLELVRGILAAGTAAKAGGSTAAQAD